jgi:hypothetical protein
LRRLDCPFGNEFYFNISVAHARAWPDTGAIAGAWAVTEPHSGAIAFAESNSEQRCAALSARGAGD